MKIIVSRFKSNEIDREGEEHCFSLSLFEECLGEMSYQGRTFTWLFRIQSNLLRAEELTDSLLVIWSVWMRFPKIFVDEIRRETLLSFHSNSKPHIDRGLPGNGETSERQASEREGGESTYIIKETRFDQTQWNEKCHWSTVKYCIKATFFFKCEMLETWWAQLTAVSRTTSGERHESMNLLHLSHWRRSHLCLR